MGALRVLFLTADREFAHAVAAVVRALGHDVEVHDDEREAGEAAQLLPPHVVLVDQNADTDGHALCQRLRQTSQKPMRLVAITDNDSSDHLARCRAAGFDFRFTKPLVADDLERFLSLSQTELL